MELVALDNLSDGTVQPLAFAVSADSAARRAVPLLWPSLASELVAARGAVRGAGFGSPSTLVALVGGSHLLAALWRARDFSLTSVA